jgi:HK97 family phage major capsid protein
MENLLAPKLDQIQTELKAFVERHTGKSQEMDARLLQLEQAFVARPGAPGAPLGLGGEKSLGCLVVESDGFQSLKRGAKETGKILVGTLHKAGFPPITGMPGGALVPPTYFPQIIPPGLRPLTIRDLLTVNRSNSNLIQYTREESFSNSAAPQGGEGTDKPQSNLTFSLQNAPIQTLAHWISVSTQLLDDAPGLEDYINSRLMYGMKLVEEQQMLLGDGTGFNLHGIIPQASAYSGSTSGTAIDVLGRALEQVGTSGFLPDAIVLSLSDAWSIYLQKSTIGTYILGDSVQNSPTPRLWGTPIVISLVLSSGTFLVGAFKQGAALWDRMDATLLVSREHSDYFVKNLAAILAEERVAMTVFRPSAFCTGSLPTGS